MKINVKAHYMDDYYKKIKYLHGKNNTYKKMILYLKIILNI